MNEAVLLVVKSGYQGSEIGKKLWLRIKKACSADSQEQILVETNKKGAGKFYEKLGFKHYMDFDSPLHKLATPSSQACIYPVPNTFKL
ncbi:GNAT family N-acetyltransferase [Gilvimarinus sp. 1_MG-2023]|uniref:GNAT family N-acetyltransferase n=1 Tax=Gilvimarinus sp. 1_MG-2023 TaxID=3062638 RepID=UPI003FA5577E